MPNPQTKMVGVSHGQRSRHLRHARITSRAEQFGTGSLEEPNPKVRYAFVPGRLQNWTIPSLLPDHWLDFVLGRMMGLNPNS